MGEEVSIRGHTERDFDELCRIRMSWRTLNEPAFMARLLRREITDELTVLVAEREGVLLGYAFTMKGQPPETAWPTQVMVLAEHRGQGVGRQLWSQILPVPPPETVRMTLVLDDDDRSLEVAKHWGFEQVQYGAISTYAVTGSERVPSWPDGFEVAPPVGLDDLDEASVAAVALSDTSPEAEASPGSLFPLIRRVAPRTQFRMLRVDGRPIGVVAHDTIAPQEWLVVFTGVVSEYRGRGFARMLKEHLHAEAAAAGVHRLVTSNEAANTAIRSLNEVLGYERGQGEIRLRRYPA